MNRRGVTLVELLVGIATAVVIGAVSASILKAGIMTYNHSVRQNDALTRMRKALGGEGSAFGVLRAGRAASSVSALNASSVGVLSSTSSVLTSYYVSAGGLYRSVGGASSLHADKVTSIAVNYYNLDGSGLIVESTAAASAQLVTALVTLRGQNNKQKDYHLFSGTLLRNHSW
jgi:hypothetical protein